MQRQRTKESSPAPTYISGEIATNSRSTNERIRRLRFPKLSCEWKKRARQKERCTYVVAADVNHWRRRPHFSPTFCSPPRADELVAVWHTTHAQNYIDYTHCNYSTTPNLLLYNFGAPKCQSVFFSCAFWNVQRASMANTVYCDVFLLYRPRWRGKMLHPKYIAGTTTLRSSLL